VPLLLSYLSLFVMLSGVVRRTEVRPFLLYTLGLGVICALGMLVEYRTQYNVFFDSAAKLLPGSVFKVTWLQSGYDFGGRRLTHGPAVHGLVAVTMLSMALPIAVVGLVDAVRWRPRVLYGLAACVLMAAMLATQRKTALIAPGFAVLTLAYFRRGELLRLAPVAAVLLVALVLVSPGTITPVIDQFRGQELAANTVSDRASDYDAIRPDVLSHLALGRGYGSYQPLGHRILDSEILVRLVETGVFGLLAFLMLAVSVLGAVRRTIGSRHPTRAPSALACAAVAVVFLVTATLFDTMSFPQVPYIFLCFAAFAAALVTPERAPADGD
jgi:O-antigen ligase